MRNDSLMIGKKAPDFIAKGVIYGNKSEDFRLSDYRGRWVVVFFYPLDFSTVCPTEVKEFSERIEEFDRHDATVFGVSTQSPDSHEKWMAELGEIRYPLLSDEDGRMSDLYGTLTDEGLSLRGTFIIDPESKLRFALYHDNAVGRSVSETLRVLAALRTGEMCPAEWQPGESTLGSGDAVRVLA